MTSTLSDSSRPDETHPESLSQALEREHREIDEAIITCSRATGASPEARAGLQRALVELRWHIFVEEELLFPPLRAAGMTGPILVMLREHAQMWPVLDTLDRALREDDDHRVVRASCRELLALLQHHNPKEERILYPQVDQVLGVDASVAVRDFLSGGQIPSDWVCHNLRAERAGD